MSEIRDLQNKILRYPIRVFKPVTGRVDKKLRGQKADVKRLMVLVAAERGVR